MFLSNYIQLSCCGLNSRIKPLISQGESCKRCKLLPGFNKGLSDPSRSRRMLSQAEQSEEGQPASETSCHHADGPAGSSTRWVELTRGHMKVLPACGANSFRFHHPRM